MKVLNPAVSIVLASHLKPQWLPSSLDSILAQTRRDIQIVVIDSGEWISSDPAVTEAHPMDPVRRYYGNHPLIEWYSLGEQPGLIDRACPISYVVNTAFHHGLNRGTYTCVFTDDDLYKPNYVERMAGYLDEHPQHDAVWCSQDRVRVGDDGVTRPDGMLIRADHFKVGAEFDQKVDFLQLMFRTSLLGRMSDPWLDNSPADAECRHSDGRFMDRIGQLAGSVPCIDEVLVTHRYTPLSTYN